MAKLKPKQFGVCNMWTLSGQVTAASHSGLASASFGFAPARLIFVNTPSGAGSAEGVKSADINADNIGEKLLELQDEKSLNAEQISAALNLISKGDKKKIAQLVRHAKELADGSVDKDGFALRLKFLTGKEAASTPEKPAENTKPEASEEQVTKADIEKLQLGYQKRIDELLLEVNKLSEVIKSKTSQNPELTKQMEGIAAKLEVLKKKDKTIGGPLKREIAKLYKSKKITREEAHELFDLPPYLGNNAPEDEKDPTRKKWYELTHNLSDADRNNLKSAKLGEEKELNAIDKEIKELLHEFRNVFKKMSDEVLDLAAREKSVENLGKATGFSPLRKGQVLVYALMKENEKGDLVKTKGHATIKDITFAEIIERDDAGNIISKRQTNQPLIVVETILDGEKKTENLTYGQFIDFVETQGASEDFRSPSDLEASIGESIQVGDKFEFRQRKDASDYKSAEDIVVEVKAIEDGMNEFGEPAKLIRLDKPIMVRPTQNEKRDLISLGEFAKWFKRDGVMKSIESLPILQAGLIAHNEALNKKHNRNPSFFPPIEVKEKESLKYDDGSGKFFIIQEVGDNKIRLNTDDPPFTYAGFLRWVKDNEVEKYDPNIDAKREASHVDDEEERAELEKKIQREKDQAILDAIEHAKHADHHGHGHGHGHGEANHSTSYLRKLWMSTEFMTLHNFMEMGKTIFELIKRKLHRREHGAIGVVGEKMFSGLWTELGAEFKGVAQHAENEEVNHHVEHFKTMGIETVKHELHTAPTKDILKAAITALADKGQIRWDDAGLHESINKFGQGTLYDDKGQPLWVNEKNHMEAIEKYLDHWFGQDTFREFRNKQDSSYNSIKKNFEDNAKRLENDPMNNGGLLFAIQNLLYKHLRGEYVNPAEYEEYLHFAIQAGKLAFEDKLFFLIMGIGAEAPGEHGHAGQTLLHIDRVGAIESELLNNFPILDFFTEKSEQIDENGHPIPEKDEHGNIIYENGAVKWKTGKPTIKNFHYWLTHKCLPDLKVGSIEELQEKAKSGAKDFGPSSLRYKEGFSKFFMEEMAWNPAFRTRLEKSARDGTNYDHDDCHIFGPLMGEETIQQFVARAGGSKQAISNIGLRNTIAGFGEFLKVKMSMLKDHSNNGKTEEAKQDIRDMVDLMRTFIRFDALIDKRFQHEAKSTVVRLGSKELSIKPLVDGSRPAQKHLDEVRAFIGGLADQFELSDEWTKVMKNLGAAPSKEDADEQTKAVTSFGKLLEGKLSQIADKNPGEVSKILSQIQKNNEKRDLSIQGILDKPKTKQDVQQDKEGYKLHPYSPEEIMTKVSTIKSLQEKIIQTSGKTQKEMAAEESLRLRQILEQVKKEDYTPKEGDGEILDSEIGKLRDELRKKKTGEKPSTPPPSQPRKPTPLPAESEEESL